MSLLTFLQDPRNSQVRESLINNHFYYNIKLAGAKGEVDLQLFRPEVDKEGYDLIINDGDKISMLQLKTKCESSATDDWDIQKQLLRPGMYNARILGFEESPEGVGYEGSFILIVFNIQNSDLIFQYYYTDIFILKAIEEKIIKLDNDRKYQSVLNAINDLSRGSRYDKVNIKLSSLIKISDVSSLLALSDINSEKLNNWRFSFIQYIKSKKDIDKEESIKNLKELIDSEYFD
jgi:hypothetical protein